MDNVTEKHGTAGEAAVAPAKKSATKKKRFASGVNAKLTLMCLILAIVICIGCCISGYYQYRDSIYQSYNNFAYELCEIARNYVDGDSILKCLETGEPNEAYENMDKQIYSLYKSTTLSDYNSGIYICIPNRENLTLTNLYDVRINVVDDDSKQYYALGAVDPIAVDNVDNSMSVFETGERSSDYFIHETKFGYNSSAILPVYNSAGQIVAQIVTDMPIPHISEDLNRFLMITILLTALIVIVFIAIFIFIMRKMLTSPLKLIAKEAEAFTEGNMTPSENLKKIHKNDEIGHLSNSIYKMETEIVTYMNNLTAVTAEKERIATELNVAADIQTSLLPSIFPAFPQHEEFDIYATMNPAKEVGGDFYDFFLVDDTHIAMVMADVSGKGVPAALFMTIAKTLIKNRTLMGGTPAEILNDVNEQLNEGNKEGLFVTVWLSIFDLKTGKGLAANAGHEHPVIRRAGGNYELVEYRHSPAVGVIEGIRFKEHEFEMYPGDRLFVYTDGVCEATNASKVLYGDERMLNALNKLEKDASLKEVLSGLRKDIDLFVAEAPQFDDITMLAFDYLAESK